MRLKPFKLERYFAKHEFSAPYLLCSSDCESMALRDLLALDPDAAERFSSLWLGYTESLGDPRLRQAITTLYEGVTADQVLVHSGAEEAIFNFMNVALSSGDHVIVHAPYYQSLGEVARSIGAEVSEWRGDPAHAWELDLGAFKSILTSRTKGTVHKFCTDLVEKAGVLLLPGTLYSSELNSFRVGFGRKNLPEALHRLAEHLREAR